MLFRSLTFLSSLLPSFSPSFLPSRLPSFSRSLLPLQFYETVFSNEDPFKKPQGGDSAGGARPHSLGMSSRKRVNLIDMKRGQNAGIALARIKMSFAEVKERISLMDDEIFTTDQLRSLSVRPHCTSCSSSLYYIFLSTL